MDDYLKEMYENANTLTTTKQDNTTMSNRVIVGKQNKPEVADLYVTNEYRLFLYNLRKENNG